MGNALELPETPNSDQFQTEMYHNQIFEIDNELDEAATPAEISLQPVDSGRLLQKSTYSLDLFSVQLTLHSSIHRSLWESNSFNFSTE